MKKGGVSGGRGIKQREGRGIVQRERERAEGVKRTGWRERQGGEGRTERRREGGGSEGRKRDRIEGRKRE